MWAKQHRLPRAACGESSPTARRRQRIDLRCHYDHAPYTVHELLPLYRVSRLFMSMGLRHLCVLDGSSRVVGIITRKDLARIPTGHMGRDSQHLDASLHGLHARNFARCVAMITQRAALVGFERWRRNARRAARDAQAAAQIVEHFLAKVGRARRDVISESRERRHSHVERARV